MAQLVDGQQVVQEVPLQFTGTTSTYSGRLPVMRPGEFELRALAMDGANANFGMHTIQLYVKSTD